MKKCAAILLVALAWLCFRSFARRNGAAQARVGILTVPKEAESGTAAAHAAEAEAMIVDDACEQQGKGWYFLGPDKLIGFSSDTCAAAFEAWRNTTYPLAPLASM